MANPIDLNDLKPGDIIFEMHDDRPYHAMIYAPEEGKVADVIHAAYDDHNQAVIASSLTKLLIINKPNDDVSFLVLRCKAVDGAAVAAQARHWLMQGLVYDVERVKTKTLVELEHEEDPHAHPEQHIFQHLKAAARRETSLIKPQVPDSGIRQKGTTCATFVLACIAAVALKSDIQAVSEATGWVSVKRGKKPAHSSAKLTELYIKALEASKACSTDAEHGLHELFTEDQISKFNLLKLKTKLTSGVYKLNPKMATVKQLFETIRWDCQWQEVGDLEKKVTRPEIDKTRYVQEKAHIAEEQSKQVLAFPKKFPRKRPPKVASQ